MKWIAIGQRIREFEAFEKARIFASGYVVDSNRIDILEGWWWLRLPNWTNAMNPVTRRYQMAQKILVHTRTHGFEVRHDFEAGEHHKRAGQHDRR